MACVPQSTVYDPLRVRAMTDPPPSTTHVIYCAVGTDRKDYKIRNSVGGVTLRSDNMAALGRGVGEVWHHCINEILLITGNIYRVP